MPAFHIKGGSPLSGPWSVQGGKNAATPIVAASLLTDEECVIRNVPRIADMHQMLSILEYLGSVIVWEDEHTLRIRTKEVSTKRLDYHLAKSMRSSVLLIGPLLGRLGMLELPEPGGCSIGNRPLNAHFTVIEDLGGTVEKKDDGYYTISGGLFQGGVVRLIEKSVTATENAMMAASRIPHETVIENCATEPHIACLAGFLRSMGVTISGEGTRTITMTGSEKLDGCDYTIIPDQLEVGTIAVLAALTEGEIDIHPVVPKDMEAVERALRHAGVRMNIYQDRWIVQDSRDVLSGFDIAAAPHPAFPTDLQAPFGVLATQANGLSTICDPMYENRLGYLEPLVTMGALAEIHNEHVATITGPTPLSGSNLSSLDLRAGATLLIAALIAQGESVINAAEIIDRGYERIDERLRGLGADIQRVD